MDSVDLKIIDILQADGRITMKELGSRIGMTSPATIERVKKLEESGIIAGYKAMVSIKRAGLPIRAFLLLTASAQGAEGISGFAQSHQNILRCHRVAGSATHLLEAAVPDLAKLEVLLSEVAAFGQVEPFLVLSSPLEDKAVVFP